MAQSPEQMADSMIANMKEKTGKTLEQWLKIVDKNKHQKHGEIIKMLKQDHGMTHGFANMVAHKSRERDEPRTSKADLVESQYSGAKSDLRSIYDAIIKAVRTFGEDVEISPKKAYVSLRRSKQFAIVQPSTKTRIDVGINLKGVPTTDRLEASGSFNSMVSHRVRLENQKDVDKELIGWLKEAHQRS